MIVAISKGQQITIPSDMRADLGLGVGSKVDVEEEDGKIIITPIGKDLESLFEKAKKIKPKKHLTAKEMDNLTERMIR